MDAARPLICTLKSIIERSYGMPQVIDDVSPFIIGDEGLRALYERPLVEGSEDSAGPRLLLRHEASAVRASVYYPDSMVRHLERFNPLAGLGDVNIDAFAALVEELDHLLTIASRMAEQRPVTQVELEYHAGVTKYLLVLHFLGKQTSRRRGSESLRLWARHHLFEKYAPGPGQEESRYRDAARLARRHVEYLDRLSVARRHEELRALQRRSFSETYRLLASVN